MTNKKQVKSEPKGITFEVEPEARRALRVKAAEHDTDYTSFVEALVNNLAKNHIELVDQIMAKQ